MTEQATDSSLETWTLYRNPSDYPGKLVVRRGTVTKEGLVQNKNPYMVKEDTVEAHSRIHALFDGRGLHFVPRAPQDDPVILGVWL